MDKKPDPPGDRIYAGPPPAVPGAAAYAAWDAVHDGTPHSEAGTIAEAAIAAEVSLLTHVLMDLRADLARRAGESPPRRHV